MRAAVRLITVLLVALAMTGAAQAQSAAISGTVVDASNAPVPGATVDLSGPGPRMSMRSGADGRFTFRASIYRGPRSRI